MQRLYFVPLALLASVASANTADAENCDASDESTLLQLTKVSELKPFAAEAASISTVSTDQQHQLDAMYNAVAALVTKQAKSSAKNVTDVKRPSSGPPPTKMLQDGADPFGALNDAFQNVAKQAKDVVDKAKEKVADLADDFNMSSITDGLGDMVSGKGADVLKKLGDLKDQFADKLNSTVGEAMGQFGDLKDKLEDAKDAQVLKVAKSIAKAGNMTQGMAQNALEKVQDKMTELEGLKDELDKISTEDELAAAKEKLYDRLDGMSGLLSLLNSVAHTDIDLTDAKAEGDELSDGVEAKVNAAKAQLQKALDKAKSAERAGQTIVDTLKTHLAKIDDSIAQLEAKAAAKDEGEDKSNKTEEDAEKVSAMSVVKSLFNEVNVVRQVIQGTYKPDDGEQDGADAESNDSADNADEKLSDNGDAKPNDNGDAKSSENGDAKPSDSDAKAEKSTAFATAGISTIFLGVTVCNTL